MKRVIIILLSATCILSACSGPQTSTGYGVSSDSVSGEESKPSSSFGEILDKEILDEEVAVLDNQTINLSDVNDNLVNITNTGNYVLTGTFNGQIRVEINNDATVKLTLSDVSIKNEGAPCIYFVNGDKLTVSAADGTVNRLTSTGSFSLVNGKNVNGVIFAKDNLHLSGHGEIIIESECGHGIVTKDNFVTKNVSVNITSAKKGIKISDKGTFKSGAYKINAGSEGIEGKILNFEDAVLDITAGDDGINGSDGSGKSNTTFGTQSGVAINISGGEISINAGGDGIDSNGDLCISGGILNIIAFNTEGDSALEYSGDCQITGGTLNVPE